MNHLKYTFPLVLLILLGCSEEFQTDSQNFVVEGFIVANEKVNNIKIKSISPINNEEVSPSLIPNATVSIINGNTTFPLSYNNNTGLYETDDDNLNIIYNAEYSIDVKVNDRIATATTKVPNPPTGLSLSDNTLTIPQLRLSFTLRNEIGELFDEERITLKWDAKAGQSYFVVIENKAAELDPILPNEVPDEAKELLSSFRFISAPTEENSFEIIGIALETYGPHVAKVYTVNQEYVDLYNNSEQDSRDLNEPPSNISNALGIFTAFAVDSLAFEVVRP